MIITFVTGNSHKVEEAAAICMPLGIEIVQNDCGYPELQDDDVAAVAAYGAENAANRLGSAVIVEDTGFYIDALHGFPGPYAAYVQEVIGYCKPDIDAVTFEGAVTGRIAYQPEGEGGFGYDPIFEIGGVTLASMGGAKNKVSHRGKSFEKFADWFLGREGL
jgi:XTP/dITP diphosphohydrolase